MTYQEVVRRVTELMEEGGFPWAFCGGWAVDLFAKESVRAHKDIDLLVPIADRPLVIAHMLSRRWQVFEACGGGIVHKVEKEDEAAAKTGLSLFCTAPGFRGNQFVRYGTRELSIVTYRKTAEDIAYLTELYKKEEHMGYLEWGETEPNKADYIEVMFYNSASSNFIIADNPSIFLPKEEAFLSREGCSFLSPVIVLLYKLEMVARQQEESRMAGRKELIADFLLANPYLSEQERSWFFQMAERISPHMRAELAVEKEPS